MIKDILKECIDADIETHMFNPTTNMQKAYEYTNTDLKNAIKSGEVTCEIVIDFLSKMLDIAAEFYS